MESLSYKTVFANPATVDKKWHIIDAKDQILGRLSTTVAAVLIGKSKTDFTPNADNGDFVIVINASQVKLSGKKLDEKEYITYSGYPGGQKRILAGDLVNKKPTALVEEAVRGMLPKNRLGRKMFHHLFVFEGSEHPHQAQQPKELKLKA